MTSIGAKRSLTHTILIAINVGTATIHAITILVELL